MQSAGAGGKTVDAQGVVQAGRICAHGVIGVVEQGVVTVLAVRAVRRRGRRRSGTERGGRGMIVGRHSVCVVVGAKATARVQVTLSAMDRMLGGGGREKRKKGRCCDEERNSVGGCGLNNKL